MVSGRGWNGGQRKQIFGGASSGKRKYRMGVRNSKRETGSGEGVSGVEGRWEFRALEYNVFLANEGKKKADGLNEGSMDFFSLFNLLSNPFLIL